MVSICLGSCSLWFDSKLGRTNGFSIGIITASLLNTQHHGGSVENKPASLPVSVCVVGLPVLFGKALSMIPPFLSSRQRNRWPESKLARYSNLVAYGTYRYQVVMGEQTYN